MSQIAPKMDMPASAPPPDAGHAVIEAPPAAAPPQQPPPRPTQFEGRTASEVLKELTEAFEGDKISVGELLDRLDSRAHGVLLLILALPMCIPNIPGISTIFGVLMIAPALGLLFGQRRLWVPQKVRDWKFSREGFTRALNVAIAGLRRVEFLIKPRLSLLTRWPVTSAVGFQTLLMALVLILPIWGANLTPGVTVTLTALALMQRDGVLMLLSVPCAIGSIVWVYLFTKYGVMAAAWLGNWLEGVLPAVNLF
ncbi:MAG TPA: exopolysaccharide biosynthesis protein [Vitreimonas sp.]|uniref:exopolysaccharide biosynthesis protein n=1 Tax=Vitreimonas sp. TaxID=3069702 RepID=UPI002D29EF38|nr:exopolysaccharide biosynthesis protein [Vitreimonas sp.]HYD86524.1 exopolysaccharide biosynthesis protein [Vitreimonas sp.]